MKNNCIKYDPCPGTSLIGVIGPQGPQGPPGPAATLDSILIDNDGTQSVASNASVNLGTIINQTGTSMTYTTPDTVSLEPGTYYILYEALISNTAGQSGDVGASLMINGVAVPNASEYVPATTTQTQIALQHNLTISETTLLTIDNLSTVSNQYHDSSLSIIKLG